MGYMLRAEAHSWQVPQSWPRKGREFSQLQAHVPEAEMGLCESFR